MEGHTLQFATPVFLSNKSHASSLHQSSLNFLPAVTEVHDDDDEFSASTLADLLLDALFIFIIIGITALFVP
jgi:hypothetical protein